MMDNERSVPGCLLALVVITVLGLSVWACGATPQQDAHRTVTAIATAVEITDVGFAQVYTARAHEALAAASSLAEYHASMEPFDIVVRAERAVRVALEVGEAVIAIWDQGGVSSWPQALSCIVGGLMGLRDALVAAGVTLPPELAAVLDTVHGLVDTDACFTDASVPVDAGVDGGA